MGTYLLKERCLNKKMEVISFFIFWEKFNLKKRGKGTALNFEVREYIYKYRDCFDC